MRNWRHPWLVVSLVALAGVLLLGSFPVRAYLEQVSEREQLASRAQSLAGENQKLAQEVQHLQTDETIEYLARARYQLVRPGEEAYAILPDGRPAAETTLPGEAPVEPPPAGGGWWSRAWGWLTSIF